MTLFYEGYAQKYLSVQPGPNMYYFLGHKICFVYHIHVTTICKTRVSQTQDKDREAAVGVKSIVPLVINFVKRIVLLSYYVHEGRYV